jgi:hypothetical protein
MNTTNHLGERRFLESPVIAAEEWGLPADLAPGVLTPARIAGAAALLAAIAAGVLLCLR